MKNHHKNWGPRKPS